MTPIKRPLAAVGAAALLALSLTACGGGGPTDASKEDFCSSIKDTVTSATSVKGDEPTEDEWKDIQKAYEDLGDTGTPEDIGEDERNGFEVITDAISGLDYNEAKKSFGDEDGSDEIPGVSKDEQADAEKFFTYASKTCEDAFTPDSGDTSSDVPSELPSEMPSDLPSDLPTDLSDLPSEMPSELESLLSDLPTDAS